jgi:hypothetical protein
VFTRPFEPSGGLQPTFSGAEPIDVSFAVWDGSRQERDGLKSVSTFTQLTITPEDPPRRSVPASGDWPAYAPPNGLASAAVTVTILLLVGIGVLWLLISLRQALRRADVDES